MESYKKATYLINDNLVTLKVKAMDKRQWEAGTRGGTSSSTSHRTFHRFSRWHVSRQNGEILPLVKRRVLMRHLGLTPSPRLDEYYLLDGIIFYKNLHQDWIIFKITHLYSRTTNKNPKNPLTPYKNTCFCIFVAWIMAFAWIPLQQLHSLHTIDEKARSRLMLDLGFEPGMGQRVSRAQGALKLACF